MSSKVYLIGIPEESRYKIGYTNSSIFNRTAGGYKWKYINE